MKIRTKVRGGGSTVNDIKIQGNSIVENGIAEIPISTGYGTYGLQKVYGAQYTSGIKTDEFGLRLSSTNAGRLAKRASGGSNTPIQESTIDIAVKAAMTDGIGAEWTDTEKQGALERMGITVDENGICRFGK